MRWSSSYSLLILIFVSSASLCSAFYLPGLAPVTYCKEEDPQGKCQVREEHCFGMLRRLFLNSFLCLFQTQIKLFVNRLNSEESVIPYEYEQ